MDMGSARKAHGVKKLRALNICQGHRYEPEIPEPVQSYPHGAQMGSLMFPYNQNNSGLSDTYVIASAVV